MDKIFYSFLSIPILIVKFIAPYSSRWIIIIPILFVFTVVFIFSLTRNKLRKYFQAILFIYLLIISGLLLLQGIRPRPPQDIISTDLRENRNYAITICLSCIGIE